MFSPEFVTSATRSEDVLVLTLRLNWFRALPLSCIEELTVSVDGAPCSPGVLTLDGAQFDADRLGQHDDVWWRVLSDAVLSVPWPATASSPEGRVTIRTRIPLLVDHVGSPVLVVDSAVVAVEA